MMHLKALLALMALFVLSGCVTPDFALTPEKRIERYILDHPEMSAKKTEGMRHEVPVVGMTRDEVRLTLGKAAKVEADPDSDITTWIYYEDTSATAAQSKSGHWAMKIPQFRITLDEKGVVAVKEFTGRRVLGPRKDDKTARIAAKARAASRPPARKKRVIYTQGTFKGWPLVSLGSVIGSGSQGSAILNGNVTSVGDVVDGVQLMSVHAQGVHLKYNGKTQFLTKNSSTH
jgi:outer membrane protein assembly factor BamE (lipoprotein component of BamABCDE complex)